jgi:hypothetical protein
MTKANQIMKLSLDGFSAADEVARAHPLRRVRENLRHPLFRLRDRRHDDKGVDACGVCA